MSAPTNKASFDETGITEDVKLVIWDLDETLWRGTLAEEQIEFVDVNNDVVRTLASRGIVSSIASKNDADRVQSVLAGAGLWDYFVFPSISYTPKGERIAAIIQNAALRAENVLFIDDNAANLEEARFFNPRIMLLHSDHIGSLARHPRLQGKPDPNLKRLRQYQLLERKLADRQSNLISNDEFLRQSNITLCFHYDVENHLERIVDLINRTNQLNYTKKRLNPATAITELKQRLNTYGVSAACISCSDRYGDYGIVGFYLMERTDKHRALEHFVFSCRTMNMGIESFVYQHLKTPDVQVASDVAYPLEGEKTIDWISVKAASGGGSRTLHGAGDLLLVGGCELQQLSAFFGIRSMELVNRIVVRDADEFVVRYDDPSFFISDRAVLAGDSAVSRLVSWTHDEAIALDEALARSDVVILGLRAALRHHYVRSKTGILVRMERRNLKLYQTKNSDWFNAEFSVVNLSVKDRLDLVRKALELIAGRQKRHARAVLIGANTRGVSTFTELAASSAYNNLCRDFCNAHADQFLFVDVDQVAAQEHLADEDHFTRAGYHAIFRFIEDALAAPQAGEAEPLVPLAR